MTASALNGELDRRTSVDPNDMDWIASPGGEVLRKRLHRVGPPESGQVTSIVRYQPGSRFPSHPHPGGEPLGPAPGPLGRAPPTASRTRRPPRLSPAAKTA